MKIDKAIEILTILAQPKSILDPQDKNNAIKLGINALIFYRKLNDSNTGEIQGNFLGETQEER